MRSKHSTFNFLKQIKLEFYINDESTKCNPSVLNPNICFHIRTLITTTCNITEMKDDLYCKPFIFVKHVTVYCFLRISWAV